MNDKILICIFNYRCDDNAKLLLSHLSPYFKTVVLDSGNDHIEKDFIQFPNIYYSGLWNEMKKYASFGNYEYVGLITSDVEFTDVNYVNLIDRINWLYTTKNVGLWQPAISNVMKSWPHYKYNKNEKLLQSNLLEGMMQIIKKDVLNSINYINVKENLYGWGIDIDTSLVSTNMKYLNVIDNNVQMFHPNHTGYNSELANKQGNVYLMKRYHKTAQQFAGEHYIKPLNENLIQYK